MYALLLLTVASGLCFADEPVGGAVVLVDVRSVDEGLASARRVVASSVELELEREGLIVRYADAETRSSSATPEGGLPPYLRDAARDTGAHVVLRSTLAGSGDRIDVLLELYDASTVDLLSRRQSSLEVDLSLDRSIARLTQSLIEPARPALARAASRAATDATARAHAGPDPAATPDGRTGPQDQDVPEARSTPDGRTGSVEAGSTSAAPDLLFTAGTGYAPFLPIEPTSDYLGASYQAAKLSLFALPLPGDLLALGLSVRGVLATAAGASAAVDVQMLPVGLSARFRGGSQPLVPYLQLTGGVAVLRFLNDVLGSYAGVVPYAAGELGMRLRLWTLLGIELSVGFEAVLEESLWIMGFSPGLGISVEI